MQPLDGPRVGGTRFEDNESLAPHCATAFSSRYVQIQGLEAIHPVHLNCHFCAPSAGEKGDPTNWWPLVSLTVPRAERSARQPPRDTL